MSKRWLWLVPAALVLAAWATMPARLDYAPGMNLPPPPDGELVPGTEERVTAANPASDHVVVVLHGFSGSRQELAPLGEIVADELDASLVEVRLAGHGLASNPMQGVYAEHWMADAERVLGAAAELGNDITIIGNSTGATLAAAMLDQKAATNARTIVMLSPNFLPSAAGASLVTGPGGQLLPRLIAGETRCWEPANELQARYWSTCYPSKIGIEVMRLVDRANAQMRGEHRQDLLVFYSPKDKIVSPDAIVAAFEAYESPRKLLVKVTDSGDANDHILAGDIMSPGTTQRIADTIVDFIRPPAP